MKCKYFLFIMLFYTNSIKQCSVVLNEESYRYEDNNDYYKNTIFNEHYYEYSINETTKIIYKTTTNNKQNHNNSTNCNTNGYCNSNKNSLDLLSRCHLTISPIYDNISILKYFLLQRTKKCKKSFFHRLLNFKLVELTDLINDINGRLNDIKLLKMSYNNLTKIGNRVIDQLVTNFTLLDAKEINKYSQNDIYYESVYFNIINKSITKMILKDANENSNEFLVSNGLSNYDDGEDEGTKNEINKSCDFYIDLNYWNNIYFETFDKSLGLSVSSTTASLINPGIVSNNDSSRNENDTEIQQIQQENDKQFYYSGDDKIFFSYETEHVLDLNLNLNAIFNSILISYAIIYDKQLHMLYLSIQTDTNKNLRFKLSDYKRDFWYKSNDPAPFKTKIKSTKFDIIKYGVFANFSLNCESTSTISYIHEYDCDIKQESSLLESLKSREQNPEIENLFLNYLRTNIEIRQIESTRCIIHEYFGRIFTCCGRQITTREYAILKRRGLKLDGVIIKIDNKKFILELDQNGFIIESKDKVVLKSHKNSPSAISSCHECAKMDLRVKVEANKAYNQYKQAIKDHKYSSDHFMVLAIVIAIIFFVYLRSFKSKK